MTDLATLARETEALATAFAAFRTANDERLAQVERLGSADAVTQDKVASLNGEVGRLNDLVVGLSALPDTVAAIETAMRRPGVQAKGRDLAPAAGHHGRAFTAYLRKGLDHDLSGLERKAMSVISDPDGGYLVATELSDRIIARIYETSPIRRVASTMVITADAVEGMIDTGEPETGWVGELQTRTETATPQLGMWRIPVHELYAEPRVSQKLLDDSGFDVEAYLTQKVAEKMGRVENAAFVSGNGVGMPRGFATYASSKEADGTRAARTLQHVATGAAGAFAGTDPADPLIELTYALKSGYREGANWVMNRATVAEVRKLKDATTGQYLWQPGLAQGASASLLGYPVMEAEDMPVIAASSLSIAFGDFTQGYAVVDRQGIRMLRDPYTAKPQVKFYTTKRVGGDVLDFDAIKFLCFAV